MRRAGRRVRCRVGLRVGHRTGRGGGRQFGTERLLGACSSMRVNWIPMPASHQPVDTVVLGHGCTCAGVNRTRSSPALLAPQDCRWGVDDVSTPALETVALRAAEAKVLVARGPVHAFGDRTSLVCLAERPFSTQGLIASNDAVRCSRKVGGCTIFSWRWRLHLRQCESMTLDNRRPRT